MKKFTVKAIAVALASVCGSAAFAGSITSPATDGAATKYAVEGLTNATDITGPAVVYTMGVARTTAQDFTIIMTPSAGATFTAGYCSAAVPVVGGAGGGTVTVKRASTTECAYEVDVTTDTTTATTISFSAPVFDTHTLATAGNNISVSLNLWDLGETARIDNNSALSRVVATSGNALNLTAAQDTGTVANVNDTNGPLFGFVAANDDTATVARASFVVNNNTGSVFMLPDGVTAWDFVLHGTSLAVTVAATSTAGLSGFTVTEPGAAAAPTATMGANSVTFTLVPTNLTGIGDNTITLNATAAGNVSLGTTRTFGVSAVADVATGADRTLTGNASWWVWSANAIQLSSAFATIDSNNAAGVYRRFFFQNTGAAATYTTTCLAESGVTVTPGSGGTLAAGQTVIEANTICGLSNSKTRTSVTFTINAPAANIKGVFMSAINGSQPSLLALERPYGASTY